MIRFRALANFIAGIWLITGCSGPQPNLQNYAGRYEKIIKEQTNYVDVTATNNELIITASWDKFEKPLWYLNADNFMAKGFGWAIKFTRGSNNLVNGFLMTGDTQWKKVNRDSSIYQLKKWQIFIDSAKLHTYALSANQLRSIAGKYGDKLIIMSGNNLFLIKSGNDKSQLYPISNDIFVAEGYILTRLEGKSSIRDEIEIRYQNGYKETLPRAK
jgi:hypothetical protein